MSKDRLKPDESGRGAVLVHNKTKAKTWTTFSDAADTQHAGMLSKHTASVAETEQVELLCCFPNKHRTRLGHVPKTCHNTSLHAPTLTWTCADQLASNNNNQRQSFSPLHVVLQRTTQVRTVTHYVSSSLRACRSLFVLLMCTTPLSHPSLPVCHGCVKAEG